MIDKQVKTVCPYCGVGCGMVLHVKDNEVVKLEGDPDHPANRGRLCTKGKTAHQVLRHSARLESAYVRQAREADPVPLQVSQAIEQTAARLRSVLDTHGPDAVSLYVSGQMSIEAQYLANKLAKGFIRTRHIESNSRLCMASAASGYKLSLGADGPPGSYDDFDRADVFLVIGSNMADCHPVLFLRMMERVKAGAKLIVVDPRRTATAEKADLFLQVKSGSDIALLNGLLHLLQVRGKLDLAFIESFTQGWEAMSDLLADYPPSKVTELTGLTERQLELAAQWIADADEFMSCWTMGLNQSTHGVWNTNALCNLHLATGKICRPGSGPFSLTGQPNAMGGREMGYMGAGLPGQRSALSAVDRHFVEDAWAVPRGTIPAQESGGTIDLFSSMAIGKIKACWIMCSNPVATVANRRSVIEGLQKAELVIVQDAFLDTETTRFADIVLPAALWAEGDGVMVNSERNLTLMRQAVDPPGQALPDWRLIAEVAKALGYEADFDYACAEEVFAELAQFANPVTGYDIRGVNHARLRESPIQWPCAPQSTQTRYPIRYLQQEEQSCSVSASSSATGPVFPTVSGRAMFYARPHVDPVELSDVDYPMVLNTGRVQHQWHTLTKTGKVSMLNRMNPGPFLELHPDDAAALEVVDQDSVQLTSRRGTAVLPALVTDRVMPGNCFAPMHWNDAFGEDLCVNALTHDAVDPLSLQPGFKISAVTVSRVAQHNKVQEGRVDDQQARLDALAAYVCVTDTEPPQLNETEQVYLAGYLGGLRMDQSAQTEAVPVLPAHAPFSERTRTWLDGLLAGLYSRSREALHDDDTKSRHISDTGAEIVAAARTVRVRPKVLLLWASQTGNVESLTDRYATQLMNSGFEIRMACMSDYPVADLTKAEYVLLMSSTFGDGEPPDNGRDFWLGLQAPDAPRLEEVCYAVLAFGDRLYDAFCGHGRHLDSQFEVLGATRLMERVECDADYLSRSDRWLEQTIDCIKAHDDTRRAKTPNGGLTGRSQPTKVRPAPASLQTNICLNGEGSGKDTRFLALSTQDLALDYEAGDALGVWPSNCPELVCELLQQTSLDGNVAVNVPGVGELPLADALTRHFDMTRVHPDSLKIVAEMSKSRTLKDLLADEHKQKLKQWLWGRQLVDVLHEFPVSIDAEGLLAMLRPMTPRLYSIASSPLVHPGEIHLTVSTVRYRNDRKWRKGVASTFLADRASDVSVPSFVQKSAHFHLPVDGDTPIIMVGPGTGIAPFRGFLHERRARGSKGSNWLFFGERYAATDFYYENEFRQMASDGFLTRLDVAFSRDQSQKVYVQDRMLEQGAQLWAWLQDGARFYVCGDAMRMAKDVDTALRRIAAQYGGLSDEQVGEFMSRLTRERRYIRDVY
ncbi:MULTISPECIES: bifunctional nitrate reductase/sulfite reductase flavoprotein subunit alpha [Alcaligenaceae]|uniref:Reductase n=1 Tax=Neopusillimonas maritima TaxID=2026239 RepID=A0ABX9MYW4_9BURK|nr:MULTISPECIES: bifunctional nitrate reductase/sulfite reductase flavoprotein subunit alpha [Alcaligenaceae]QIM47860.1 molybdopterin-dependent oxidoreductase [Pusillimonas sp. DMV24BSW_D]RII83176.1 reductase [Neopusillimonas maritima]